MEEGFKKFTVVSFINENTVEAVPSTWVEFERKKCYWPGGTKTSLVKCLKLKSNSDTQPGTDWELHDIEVIKSYDSYEKAVRKAERVIKSDVETSDVELSKLRRRKPQCNDDGPSTSAVVNISLNSVQPEVPNLSDDHDHPPLSDQIEDFEGSGDSVHTTGQQPTTEGNFLGVAPQSIVLVDDTKLEELRVELRAFQDETVNLLVKLQSDVDKLMRSVSLLIGTNNNQSGSVEVPLFPLKSMQDFQEAEEHLQSEESFANYVKTFSRIGGTSETKIVNNICSYMFSHDLAQSIRLTASSGKKAIDNTRLLQLICESARRSGLQKLQTNNDIRVLIGAWLRGSCDRSGGRKTRPGKHGNTSQITATQNPAESSGNPSAHSEPTND